MKRIFLYTLIVLLFSSCDLFKSKEDLLTKDTWIVYYSSVDTLKNGAKLTVRLHKLKDKDIIFGFHKDGSASIVDNGIPIMGTLKWQWNDDSKKKIVITGGNHYGEYSVDKLSSKELSLSQFDLTSGITKYLSFYHQDGEWVDDKIVDSVNKKNQ